MDWQSHFQNSPKWRNMSSSYLQCWSLKRETSTDSCNYRRRERCGASGYHFTFYPAETCELIFRADLYEFHTLWMTSFKDSLTSHIQHAARADDKTFHMSISVITRGEKTVIDYLNGAKKKAGTHQGLLLIEISCGNVFLFPRDFSNHLPVMIPRFYAMHWCTMWK